MFYAAPPAGFERAAFLRKRETKEEKILWSRLTRKQVLGFRFKRQHPIGLYIADFYCHRAKLVIEIDGEDHDRAGRRDSDKIRDFEMKTLGLRVVRFKNEEMREEIGRVMEKIAECLMT